MTVRACQEERDPHIMEWSKHPRLEPVLLGQWTPARSSEKLSVPAPKQALCVNNCKRINNCIMITTVYGTNEWPDKGTRSAEHVLIVGHFGAVEPNVAVAKLKSLVVPTLPIQPQSTRLNATAVTASTRFYTNLCSTIRMVSTPLCC